MLKLSDEELEQIGSILSSPEREFDIKRQVADHAAQHAAEAICQYLYPHDTRLDERVARQYERLQDWLASRGVKIKAE